MSLTEGRWEVDGRAMDRARDRQGWYVIDRRAMGSHKIDMNSW